MKVLILNGKDEGCIKELSPNAAAHMVSIGRAEFVEKQEEPKAKPGRKPRAK